MMSTILLLISSAVPIVGVLLFGWDIVTLIALFVIEGVLALVFDGLRVAGFRDCVRIHQSGTSQAQKVTPSTVLGFQSLFVLFFGIVLMVYVWQSAEDSMSLIARFRESWLEMSLAIALMCAHQIRRFVSDWNAARALRQGADAGRRSRSSVYLRGGGYAYLFFFALCLVAATDWLDAGVLPTLIILVSLNTLGHLLMIWSAPLERWLNRTTSR